MTKQTNEQGTNKMSNIFADEAIMNNEWYVHVMELTPLPKN